jgi:hypothetical protein
MGQTSVTSAPVRAFPGKLADSSVRDIDSARVDAAAGIAPGLVVLRTTAGDKAAGFPADITADVDAIKTNIASSASIQNLAVGDFNGVIGAGRIWPPATVTLVLSNNANWDATVATLSGLDENGLPVSESLTIPDTGNTTVTSTRFYSRVTGLTIPAQSGAAGTATLGVSASRTLDGTDVLGVSILDESKTLEVTGSNANNEVHEDETVMEVLKRGHIFVTPETSYRVGDVPLVRLIAGVGETLGRVRTNSTDSGDCVPWRGAYFISSGNANTPGILRIK